MMGLERRRKGRGIIVGLGGCRWVGGWKVEGDIFALMGIFSLMGGGFWRAGGLVGK